jgi:hypothetical protein
MNEAAMLEGEPAATDGSTTAAAEASALSPRRLGVGVRRDRLAAETLRLYASDWAKFCAHCAAAGTRALPAAAGTVIAFLAGPGSGRDARTRRLAAIDDRHRQHGFTCPGNDPAVRAALRQARAALPKRSRPPPPSRAVLRTMTMRCARDLRGMRDRAVLLLLAAGLSRRVVVGLQAERLRWAEDGVRVAGASVWVPTGARHDRCPVRALEDWLRASATSYGPVFRKVTRWGTVEPAALGADAVRLILARRSA